LNWNYSITSFRFSESYFCYDWRSTCKYLKKSIIIRDARPNPPADITYHCSHFWFSSVEKSGFITAELTRENAKIIKL
jgi:hypothetical protein